MSALRLPERVERWAESEVAAGRAASVEEAAAAYRAQLDAFRASLDAAEAEADAGLTHTHEEVFAELEALYPDE